MPAAPHRQDLEPVHGSFERASQAQPTSLHLLHLEVVLEPSEIKADRRYMNSFGTTYRVSRIEGDHLVYRIEGIRMKDIRMQIEAFAVHLVREIEEDEGH